MTSTEPTWLATLRVQSVHGDVRREHIRRDHFAHAVRGHECHTLCGLTISAYQWEHVDNIDEYPRCGVCAAVPDGCLTSKGVVAATGITYRQLDFWVRQGYLKPLLASKGSGIPRAFSPSEVDVAVRMARFVAAGVLPASANHAARHGGELVPGLRIVVVDEDQAAA
jgi:hypothetical protein